MKDIELRRNKGYTVVHEPSYRRYRREGASSEPRKASVGEAVFGVIFIVGFAAVGLFSFGDKLDIKGFALMKDEVQESPVAPEANDVVKTHTGHNFKVPKQTKKWTKKELWQLVEKVAKEECKPGKFCVDPIVLQAMMDRENNKYDPSIIVPEPTLIGTKFPPLEHETEFSKALGPYAFGAMQVVWGWHKTTCQEILIGPDGDETDVEAQMKALLDPEKNIRCAYKVLSLKAEMAKNYVKKHEQNKDRLLEAAVGCYNGLVTVKGVKMCNDKYAYDILKVRMVKILAEKTFL